MREREERGGREGGTLMLYFIQRTDSETLLQHVKHTLPAAQMKLNQSTLALLTTVPPAK